MPESPSSPDLVDSSRGPTASQAAGLTLSTARAVIASAQAVEIDGVLAGALDVSGGSAERDQRAAEAGLAALG